MSIHLLSPLPHVKNTKTKKKQPASCEGRREQNIFVWSGFNSLLSAVSKGWPCPKGQFVSLPSENQTLEYSIWRMSCSPSLDGWIHCVFPHVSFSFRFIVLMVNAPTGYVKIIQKRCPSRVLQEVETRASERHSLPLSNTQKYKWVWNTKLP